MKKEQREQPSGQDYLLTGQSLRRGRSTVGGKVHDVHEAGKWLGLSGTLLPLNLFRLPPELLPKQVFSFCVKKRLKHALGPGSGNK